MKQQPSPKRKPTPDGEGTVLLRHEFSKDERLELSSRQNEAWTRIGELEASLAGIKKDYMAKIQAEEALVRQLSNQLSSGFEMRPTRVIIEFHPETNTKHFFAIEDRKKERKLGEEKMTPSDYEMPLPLDSAAVVRAPEQPVAPATPL